MIFSGVNFFNLVILLMSFLSLFYVKKTELKSKKLHFKQQNKEWKQKKKKNESINTNYYISSWIR